MKRHRLLVAAALLGLSAPYLATSTSTPAQAQVGYESNRSDRWSDRGYPHYPRVQSMRRVSWLARSVESSAVTLERNMFHRRDSLNWRERSAMNRVRTLTSAASHFRAQVQSYYRDPSHTQNDFDRLVRAFYNAGEALDNVDASGVAARSYQQLAERMEELMRSYGGANRWSRQQRFPRWYRGWNR